MPRFDGTGPKGMGNHTGRGMGKCNSNQAVDTSSDNAQAPLHKRGKGLGRGKRNGFRQMN